MKPYKINNETVKKALIVEINKLIATVAKSQHKNWKDNLWELQVACKCLENYNLYTPVPMIKIKSELIGWDYSKIN